MGHADLLVSQNMLRSSLPHQKLLIILREYSVQSALTVCAYLKSFLILTVNHLITHINVVAFLLAPFSTPLTFSSTMPLLAISKKAVFSFINSICVIFYSGHKNSIFTSKKREDTLS